MKKKVGERKEERKEEENCWLLVVSWCIKKTDREFWFGSAVLYDVYV